MKHPITITLAALLGAFGIYCTQSVAQNTDKDGGLDALADALADGPVGEASADPASGACCAVPLPKFKSLGALTVTESTPSAVLAVGAYREIVIYRVSATSFTNCGGTSAQFVHPMFRADASSPFGAVNAAESGRITVQGSDLQLRMEETSCAPSGSATYQVAAVE